MKMSNTTLPDTENYAALSGLAKDEVKKGFAAHFNKGNRYLETFLDGSTRWTVERTNIFNSLVYAQNELKKAINGGV